MKQLFLLRPYYRLIPDQQLIAGQEKSEGEHRRAARAEDGTFAVIYLPTGGSIRVITARLKGQNLHVSWFDPRIGKVVRSETVRKEAEIPLAAPSAGRGNDWVLVLDSDQENLPPIRIGE